MKNQNDMQNNADYFNKKFGLTPQEIQAVGLETLNIIESNTRQAMFDNRIRISTEKSDFNTAYKNQVESINTLMNKNSEYLNTTSNDPKKIMQTVTAKIQNSYLKLARNYLNDKQTLFQELKLDFKDFNTTSLSGLKEKKQIFEDYNIDLKHFNSAALDDMKRWIKDVQSSSVRSNLAQLNESKTEANDIINKNQAAQKVTKDPHEQSYFSRGIVKAAIYLKVITDQIKSITPTSQKKSSPQSSASSYQQTTKTTLNQNDNAKVTSEQAQSLLKEANALVTAYKNAQTEENTYSDFKNSSSSASNTLKNQIIEKAGAAYELGSADAGAFLKKFDPIAYGLCQRDMVEQGIKLPDVVESSIESKKAAQPVETKAEEKSNDNATVNKAKEDVKYIDTSEADSYKGGFNPKG